MQVLNSFTPGCRISKSITLKRIFKIQNGRHVTIHIKYLNLTKFKQQHCPHKELSTRNSYTVLKYSNDKLPRKDNHT